MAMNRLAPIQHLLRQSTWDVAAQMMRSSNFLSNKHEVGKQRFGSDDVFKVRIPELREPVTDPALGIDNNEMVFKW